MLRRILASRGMVSVGGAVLVAVLAIGVYAVVLRPASAVRAYCAMLPDTIGLYVGNHVTLRGIVVGEVTAIDPRGGTVRVDFAVDARRALPDDAGAVTVSDTVVADRDLAILPGAAPGVAKDNDGCFTRTLTPKSMTQTLDAVATLARQTLGPESGGQDALRRGLAALDRATAGTGPEINAGITDLAALMNSPDEPIADLGGLIDSLAAISGTVADRWGDIKLMLTRLATLLDQVNNELFNRTVEIIDGFRRVLPMLNEITTMFGDPIFRVLDASVPLVRLIRADVDTLHDIVTMVPALTAAATSALDPAHGISYAAPQVAVAPEVTAALCAAAGEAVCHAGNVDGRRISLAQLVLGSVGAR